MGKTASDLEPGNRVETGDGFFVVTQVRKQEGQGHVEVDLDNDGGTLVLNPSGAFDVDADGVVVIFPSGRR